MKLLRKKAFAISAMAIMIIAGIMYGSYFSISRAHHGAEQAFYRGEYYSIQDDLIWCLEYAQVMVYIAKQNNKPFQFFFINSIFSLPYPLSVFLLYRIFFLLSFLIFNLPHESQQSYRLTLL